MSRVYDRCPEAHAAALDLAYVSYKNEGRPEKTPPIPRERAEESAAFLEWQGATHVRVVAVGR